MMLVEVLGKDGDKEEQHTDSCSIVDGMAEVVVVFVGVASEVIVVTMGSCCCCCWRAHWIWWWCW